MNSKLKKRVGASAFIIGLALCGIGLCLLLSPAEYQATARIKVEYEYEPGVYDPYLIQTELEVIRSELVLGRVVEALSLNGEWGEKHAGAKRLKTSETVGLLRRRLNSRFINNTAFIDITVTDQNPVGASKIANMIAETYRNLRLEQQQKLLKAKIESGKALDAQNAKIPPVEIVNPAVPPRAPIGQSRLFGAALVFCGLAGVVPGFYLLSFRDSATKTKA